MKNESIIFGKDLYTLVTTLLLLKQSDFKRTAKIYLRLEHQKNREAAMRLSFGHTR
jgi:hypothetical protein